jgi:YYY domain-containing protein
LSRAFGLLIFGYLAWIAGSAGLTYSRATLAFVFAAIAVAGVYLARSQRASLLDEWRSSRRDFLTVEALALVFFLCALALRVANPDLWHPARGGERPMDFSYLNAVIKSTTFPPYDPWFAGGYINYYYFGFVLVGTPVKLLGIVPSIAYNLALPTVFMMVAMGAFSLGWNIQALAGGSRGSKYFAGLATAAFMVLLGNLGTVRLLARTLEGAAVHAGEWLWNPSRIIPPGGGNEITEFPLFTFLYGDLHAHMLAMPLAVLAAAWSLGVVAGRARWPARSAAGLAFALGGLTVGALYPTNLADIYTYLPLALAASSYAIWRYGSGGMAVRLARAAGAGVGLVLLAYLLYQPYRRAYVQAYGALDSWPGPFTPVRSYLAHWGLLLFTIVCWMASETRVWAQAAPRLPGWQKALSGALLATALGAAALLAARGITIAWIALPLAAWAGVLLLQPATHDAKRFVLFLTVTALLITMVVEVVVVRGDIGRQNTIFKFYLQAWMLLAVAAGAAVAWTWQAASGWRRGSRAAWLAALVLLAAAAGAYTVTATADKVRDRWAPDAPFTLDGMTFMNHAQHDDFGRRLHLAEDYRAIRWMQDHVEGSPVIVEAHCSEYRWCTRFSVYTGLPGVVGWNWHQRQQRPLVSSWVTDRVAAVTEFFESADAAASIGFLTRYGVRYIVVGQLERAQYPPAGIAKFQQHDGRYWRSVYRDGETVIYEVLP